MNHTIGVEFGAKVIPVDNQVVKLQIWDTAGQERFRSVTRSYYRGTAGAILAYDVTSRLSFAKLEGWLQDLRRLTHPKTVILLLGTKLDSDDDGLRQVSFHEGEEFAKAHGLLFAEASSKTGHHVEESFLRLAESIYDLTKRGSLDPNAADSGVQRKGPLAFNQTVGLGTNTGSSYPTLASLDHNDSGGATRLSMLPAWTTSRWSDRCNC
ncbi:Ras- protein Rab-14 [Dispira simplex]|nr:Ras- protein Rab-14 [Dispira simplex]